MRFNKTTLLLGAGFSANFGGLLGRDMWAKIYNHPDLDHAGDVKQALKSEKGFDFESIYTKFYLETEEVKKAQFQILQRVVDEVYGNMNDAILRSRASWGINLDSLRDRFINKFVDDGSGGFGACFTLNQDLFFEQHFNRQPLVPDSMLYGGDRRSVQVADLRSNKMLPTQEELNEFTMQVDAVRAIRFGLIKLHGSLNWITPNGEDAKVIGINKPDLVAALSLLGWYRNLFAEAVRQQNMRLVIYGYSFRDHYLNDIINEAIRGGTDLPPSNLKIYVITTQNPISLRDYLDNRGYIDIWNAIDGYFPYTGKDLFPQNEMETPEFKEMMRRMQFSS